MVWLKGGAIVVLFLCYFCAIFVLFLCYFCAIFVLFSAILGSSATPTRVLFNVFTLQGRGVIFGISIDQPERTVGVVDLSQCNLKEVQILKITHISALSNYPELLSTQYTTHTPSVGAIFCA